jgi:hypothetical protein
MSIKAKKEVFRGITAVQRPDALIFHQSQPGAAIHDGKRFPYRIKVMVFLVKTIYNKRNNQSHAMQP